MSNRSQSWILIASSALLLVSSRAQAQVDCVDLFPFDPIATPEFANGATIPLKINWQSFVNQGIPTSAQNEMFDLSRAALERWIAVGGLNLAVSGPTNTSATTAGAGEILILMATSDPEGDRALARAFDGSGQRIELYRKDAPNGTTFAHVFTWPTNPSDSAFVSYDVSSVVLHEMGHALGLKEHSSLDRPMLRRKPRAHLDDTLV